MYNTVVLEECYQLSLKPRKSLFAYKLCFSISVNGPLGYQIYSDLVFDLFFGLLFGDEYILFPGDIQWRPGTSIFLMCVLQKLNLQVICWVLAMVIPIYLDHLAKLRKGVTANCAGKFKRFCWTPLDFKQRPFLRNVLF